MILNESEKASLLEWAKRHVRRSDSFMSFIAPFNDRIYIDLGFHTILDNIHVRVDRKSSKFSRWLLGSYDWKQISFDEDGPWWNDIRQELPKLIDKDKQYDTAKELERKLELKNLAAEYSK